MERRRKEELRQAEKEKAALFGLLAQGQALAFYPSVGRQSDPGSILSPQAHSWVWVPGWVGGWVVEWVFHSFSLSPHACTLTFDIVYLSPHLLSTPACHAHLSSHSCLTSSSESRNLLAPAMPPCCFSYLPVAITPHPLPPPPLPLHFYFPLTQISFQMGWQGHHACLLCLWLVDRLGHSETFPSLSQVSPLFPTPIILPFSGWTLGWDGGGGGQDGGGCFAVGSFWTGEPNLFR